MKYIIAVFILLLSACSGGGSSNDSTGYSEEETDYASSTCTLNKDKLSCQLL